MANHHNDTSSVALEDSSRGTLHQLAVRAECCVEGNVDAARNVASVETGGCHVKEHDIYTGMEPVWNQGQKCFIYNYSLN